MSGAYSYLFKFIVIGDTGKYRNDFFLLMINRCRKIMFSFIVC